MRARVCLCLSSPVQCVVRCVGSTIRNTKFTHILGQYSALGIASATRVKDLWNTFLGGLGMSESVRGPWGCCVIRGCDVCRVVLAV